MPLSGWGNHVERARLCVMRYFDKHARTDSIVIEGSFLSTMLCTMIHWLWHGFHVARHYDAHMTDTEARMAVW